MSFNNNNNICKSHNDKKKVYFSLFFFYLDPAFYLSLAAGTKQSPPSSSLNAVVSAPPHIFLKPDRTKIIVLTIKRSRCFPEGRCRLRRKERKKSLKGIGLPGTVLENSEMFDKYVSKMDFL